MLVKCFILNYAQMSIYTYRHIFSFLVVFIIYGISYKMYLAHQTYWY